MMEMGERHMAGLVKKEIPVDDHRIVYLEGGKGEAILLLHGFGGDKYLWMRFARYLTGRYRVVIPDLPGFGESSQIPTATYDADSQVERIDRFTRTLGIDRFHLAGNSMGGLLAALYAATYPEKVMTLSLLAPAGVESPEPSELVQLLRKGINPLIAGDPAEYDRLLGLCFVKPPFIPAEFKKLLAADAVSHRGFNEKIWQDMRLHRSQDGSFASESYLEPYLPNLRAPVLVLWGDSDQVLDAGGAAVLEKKLPTARIVLMKQTGHMPMLEKPKEAAAVVAAFLGENR
ncbi:MAG: alpha/beta fold hydrolase [Syntrophales bacterium]